MTTFNIELDMRKSSALPAQQVTIRRGDVGTQTITASLTSGGTAYKPSGSARLDILFMDGSCARCNATISGSSVSCTLPAEAVSVAGMCRLAHFVIVPSAGKAESTEGFALRILENVGAEAESAAAEYYDDQLQALYDKWKAFNDTAVSQENSRVSAEKGRVSAESKRATAESSRASAESSRAAAETSRKTAEAARVSVENSRVSAEKARVTAETAREKASADAVTGANTAKNDANAAAADARKAAEEARGSVSADRKIYLAYDTVGDTEYITLVDTED